MSPIVASAWQLPRYGSLWIVLGYVAATLPLLAYLPLWLAPLGAVAVAWRLQVYRGRAGAPGKLLKLGLVLLCVGGLFASFARPYGLEPMATLLVSTYSLKLLELKGRRDAYITLFLGFFVAATLVLFDQGVLAGLYLLLPFTLLVSAMTGINQSDLHRQFLRPARQGLVMLGQALPLMLVLFLLLPRLGPLWSVPGLGNSAKTGMSDNLSPGDIARLGRSAQIAFRAEFDGDNPRRDQLYWRVMTFARFDGRTWSRDEGWGYGRGLIQWYGDPLEPWYEALPATGQPVDYQIIAEPTQEHWLYALERPEPVEAPTGLFRDHTLVSKVRLGSRLAYRARSWLSPATHSVIPEPELPDWVRRRMLDYPPASNPETQRIARQWASEASSTRALIDRALAMYHREFHYTLSPPTLGRHSVDDFLWRTKTGFCEHFASSFTFLMRAAGVPARVVAGYQGGEWNGRQNYWVVRQYDAHAWAEVWIEGEGWVRVDPTAAVAPERIDRSAMEFFATAPELAADTPFSLLAVRGVPWLNTLRMQLDYLQYAWGKWVLGYDSEQIQWLNQLLGERNYWRLALVFAGAATLALLPVLLITLRRLVKPVANPLDRSFQQFCTRMQRAGIIRATGEAPRDFARRCARFRPQSARAVSEIIHCYEQLRYNSDTPQRAEINQLKSLVRRFKP